MPGRPSAEIKGRFPNNVRVMRTEAGMTQEALADKMNVTTSAVGKLERGAVRLRIDQLDVLARVFQCHPVELVAPLSKEERAALQMMRTASPEMRRRLLEMMKLLLAPAPARGAKAA